FCHGEDIGRNAKVFKRKELSGSSHPALYFVKDKNRARFGTPLAQRLQIRGGWNPDTCISLYGFHNDTRRAFCNLSDIVSVSERNKAYIREQWPERSLFYFIAGNAQCAVCTAVIRPFAGNDLRPSGKTFGQ